MLAARRSLLGVLNQHVLQVHVQISKLLFRSNVDARLSKLQAALSLCSLAQGRPYEGSPMVPTHEVSTPPGFMLENPSDDEVFTIMPATFEPGKTGPFFISIATDVEFSLRR